MAAIDFDPKAKARARELRGEMKRASQEIAKHPARMRAVEREGIALQLRIFRALMLGASRGARRAGESRKTRSW